jgi:hypothetical protein
MTDPAANARTVQHIEPEETPMRIEVHDYAEPKPRARYVDTGWWLGLGIVACVSGMVALWMLLAGMW